MVRSLPLIPAVIVLSLSFTTEAAAQGRGRPKAPRPASQPTTTSAADAVTSGSSSSAAATTYRQFGAWLDDASAPTPREGRTGIGFGYWRLSGAHQINAPMLDLGYGLTDRVQVSASVPFYHTSFAGTTYRGLDDMYISGKYTVFDPTLTESQFGLAVSPVLEVLSSGATDGRLHVGFPVSFEMRRDAFRAYASAGYFTRGSVFTGGAIEKPTSSGLVFTGAVVQSYSLTEDATLDALGISKQRVDVMAGVAYPVMNTAAAYVSVGRSLTSIEQGGTIISITAGMSFRFGPANATP